MAFEVEIDRLLSFITEERSKTKKPRSCILYRFRKCGENRCKKRKNVLNGVYKRRDF